MRVLDQRKLPQSRLSTTDASGKRVYIIPAEVKGFFRNIKAPMHLVMLIIFLVLPWIHINGNQALLLDVVNRKFSIFGLTLFAHDGPLIFFILAIATLGLAFVTAIWGRVWCGWACPQTVFIDAVFRRIEKWIIGDYQKQLKFAKAPMSPRKFFKLLLKWGAFLFVSLQISHSFLAYFVGSKNLAMMSIANPTENWTTFLTMIFLTGLFLFDFGWFREQFCIIMCPYGRIQSLLMDDDSLAVVYDEKRGEPRRGIDSNNEGDCVDCYKCVRVCPTGIDIRRGMQMECIACTACIDACDSIMEKLNRPEGLIRYDSVNGLEGKKPTRIRKYVYGTLMLLMVAGLIVAVTKRKDLMINVLRAANTPYKVTSIGNQEMVINQFKIHFKNQTFQDTELNFKVPNDLAEQGVEIRSQKQGVKIAGGKDFTYFLVMSFPKELTAQNGVLGLDLLINSISKKNSQYSERLKLVGPRDIESE